MSLNATPECNVLFQGVEGRGLKGAASPPRETASPPSATHPWIIRQYRGVLKRLMDEPKTEFVVHEPLYGPHVKVPAWKRPKTKEMEALDNKEWDDAFFLLCTDERDYLETRAAFIRAVDPDILSGYNLEFDIPYLLDRARVLGTPKASIFGRSMTPVTVVKRMYTSRAVGSQERKDIVMDDRMLMDVMRILRRDVKQEFFTLNFSAETHLGIRKVDLPYGEIPKMFWASDANRWAKLLKLFMYTVRDVTLPRQLFHKLSMLPIEIEMARVTRTTINMLQTRGQGIRTQSQMCHFMKGLHLLLPYTPREDVGRRAGIEDSEEALETVLDSGTEGLTDQQRLHWNHVVYAFIAQNETDWDAFSRIRATDIYVDDDNFTGATVIKPQRGFYKNPIVTLDFAGLYPSIMRAYNICFSTYLTPQQVEQIKAGTLMFQSKLTAEQLHTMRSLYKITTEQLVRIKDGLLHDTDVLAERALSALNEKQLANLRKGVVQVEDVIVAPDAADHMHAMTMDDVHVVQDAKEPDMIAHFVKKYIRVGVLPKILEDVLEARAVAQKAKKNAKTAFEAEVQDGRQKSLKISANSMYGFMKGMILSNKYCGWAVTTIGRDGIVQSTDCIESTFCRAKGYAHDSKIRYGDTDSVFIEFGVETVAEAMKLGELAVIECRKIFPPPMSLDFEKVIVGLELDKPKRYFGLYFTKLDDPNYVEKRDVKGMQSVRRDHTGMLVDTQRAVFHFFHSPILNELAKRCPNKVVAVDNKKDKSGKMLWHWMPRIRTVATKYFEHKGFDPDRIQREMRPMNDRETAALALMESELVCIDKQLKREARGKARIQPTYETTATSASMSPEEESGGGRGGVGSSSSSFAPAAPATAAISERDWRIAFAFAAIHVREVNEMLLNGEIGPHLLIRSQNIGKEAYATKMGHLELAKRMAKRPGGQPVKVGTRVRFMYKTLPKSTTRCKVLRSEACEDPAYMIEKGIVPDYPVYSKKQLGKGLRDIFEIAAPEYANALLLPITNKRAVTKLSDEGLGGYITRSNCCIGCQRPLQDKDAWICQACFDTRPELVQRELDAFRRKGDEAARCWNVCKKCVQTNGIMEDARECSNYDCSTYYERLSLKKSYKEQEKKTRGLEQQLHLPAAPSAASSLLW